MSTGLTRNGTLSFSRRYRYEPLGVYGKESMVKSISYRRRRAKQRQVFLTTYKLSSIESFQESKSRKLKKVVHKVKKIVASVLVFMRSGSLKSCNSKSTISAATAARDKKSF